MPPAWRAPLTRVSSPSNVPVTAASPATDTAVAAESVRALSVPAVLKPPASSLPATFTEAADTTPVTAWPTIRSAETVNGRAAELPRGEVRRGKPPSHDGIIHHGIAADFGSRR